MGKGDKKSKKGKIFMGSFGNSRPKTIKKSYTNLNSSTAIVNKAENLEEAKPKKRVKKSEK